MDDEYAKRKAKKGSVAAFKHRHAVPALQLATLPPRYLDPNEALHRPRGVWMPLPSKSRARVKEGRPGYLRYSTELQEADACITL